jgi:hypothetical protein
VAAAAAAAAQLGEGSKLVEASSGLEKVQLF